MSEKKEWKKVKLGDVALYEKGKKPKNLTNNNDSIYNIPYIDILAFEKLVISKYTDGNGCVFCKENDLLMVWDGSRSGFVGKAIPGALGSTLMRIRIPQFENDFVYYFLKSKYLELNTKTKGTGTPHVDPELLWNYNIPIPPLPEQRAIVARIEELFSRLDKGIETLKQVKEQLRIYRQAVLKWAFEGKLTEEWRKSKAAQSGISTAEELLEQIKAERERQYQQKLDEWQKAVKEWEANGKQGKRPVKPKKPDEFSSLTEKELAELPRLPMGWIWTKLGEIGYWTGGSTPTKKNKSFWDNGDILWISPKDIKSKYIFNSINKITKKAICNSNVKLIPENSILFVVRSGILRRTLPISISKKRLTINQDLQALVPFLTYPEYIYWYCVSNEFNIRHKCAKSGTTVESIEVILLKNYPFILSPYCEQKVIVKEIETRFSIADKLEQLVDESLQKAEALRQSILKKAFEGKLLSEAEREALKNDPEWEPAEKLLERIKAEKAKLEANQRTGKRRKKKQEV